MNIFDYLSNINNLNKLSEKNRRKIEFSFAQRTYFTRLLDDIITMIEYENIPEGLDTTFLELYRYTYGVCGVSRRDNGDIVAFIGSHAHEVGYYGLGRSFVGADMAGNDYDFIINQGGVICKNNRLMTSDFDDLDITSGLLVESLKSIRACFINSRFSNIVGAKNSKIQAAIDKALKDVEDGAPRTFTMNLESIDEDFKTKDFEKIDLTDARMSDKLQYLFKAVDDIERQFYRHYGISLATTSKMAQQSREELNNTNALAMIYAIERLNCAREFCDDLNHLYDTNLTCHFSTIWELEYQKYRTEIENMKKGGDSNGFMAYDDNERAANNIGLDELSEKEQSKSDTGKLE